MSATVRNGEATKEFDQRDAVGLKGTGSMSAFGVFQASFDGGLRPQQRRKGRLAAIALTSAAVAVFGGGLLTILHVKSNQLSDLANTAPDVRPPAIVMNQDKSCAEQSWPFIEGRCLIDTQSLRRSERGLSRQALAGRERSGSHVLASRKKRARMKSPDGATVVTTRSRSTQTAASTTGASPRNEANSAPVRAANVANAAPPETPPAATLPAAAPVTSPTPPKINNAMTRRRAQDQRREARRKVRMTREQREARAELRARRDEQRSASRWSENSYSSSYSGGWRRGPFDGGFFSMIR